MKTDLADIVANIQNVVVNCKNTKYIFYFCACNYYPYIKTHIDEKYPYRSYNIHNRSYISTLRAVIPIYAVQQDAYQYGCICNRLHNAGLYRYDVVGNKQGALQLRRIFLFSVQTGQGIL